MLNIYFINIEIMSTIYIFSISMLITFGMGSHNEVRITYYIIYTSYIYIVILLLLFWWSPFITYRNLNEVFIYNHMALMSLRAGAL